MFIKQLYTSCLSEAAYYIESDGEAAVIDPLRDIEVYLELAKERNASIKYIFETHFHADFVSGHIDLSKATGATIVFGPQTETSFPVHVAKDGDIFPLGALSVTVLHTPGHTLESASYLLKDKEGKDHCVFTGDTLFVGDVGRPDLAQGGDELTMFELAGKLYDSLQQKIVPLHDDVIIYPAHGPGSSCGKNIGAGTSSTIGEEKKNNYALKASSKEEFIKVVTEHLPEPPEYFATTAQINKEGYESIDTVLEQALKPLSISDIREEMVKGTILLDTRLPEDFILGFIPGSINIGLDGRFAEWAGNLLPFDKSIVLVTANGKEKESVVRMARVGFDNVIGIAEGGFENWKDSGEEFDMIIDIEADELAMDLPFDDRIMVLDVRKPVEFAEGHVKDALNIPLVDLNDPLNMAAIEEDHNVYIHCASGYRSVIAASLLKRQGIHNIRNISGGWASIKEEKRIETEKDKSVLN
ncbi:MAG TPA: MBL fold metallo-hydrolase [Chitinophagaceae bacterium]|nr:MBL fold metallo-hydrolase [Chitinophagaceae bacterium]